ncbi:MAG: DUF305 domain-containing protein [Pseudobdellovibrionaceae bacterium]|nr:DUF305 domain-containing protein [Deltaproteobacteria bacterium]
MHGKHSHHDGPDGKIQYYHLLIMVILSFISMYFLMYAMVDSFRNVYSSYNQVYMAGLMTAPMVFIELVLMKMMYQNKKLNALIAAVSVIALAGFFAAIRFQVGIGDKQFLRSMIPHHAGAVLMCEQSKISNEEIKALCGQIVQGQQKEIEQMKAILDRL